MIQQHIMRALFLLFLVTTTILPLSSENEQTLLSVFSSINQTTNLDEKINAILMDDRLSGAITGVSIRNAETSELLYEHLGDVRLHPASNMKILTSIGALATLGPDYQFTTEVLIDGELGGNILDGNIYVKGQGDPTLLKKDFDQLAKEVKAYGIHHINGSLIADDSWYDEVRLSQDLNWSDESNYTGAQVSALTASPDEDYDAGTVIVEVSPGSDIGDSAQVTLIPETDYVKIDNQTETVSTNERKMISIEREHGTNTIIIEGVIPVNGTSARSWVSIWEPTGYALDIFKKSLEENDVQLDGSKLQLGITPKESTLITTKKSIPLSELLVPFMKLSNNGLGETLTKEMGKVVYDEGSWDKGLQVIEEVVAGLGMNTETILLRDGSGMSHKNMIPANEFTRLLYHIQDENWYPVFENTLPVAGEDDRLTGGTLRMRMVDPQVKGNVKAKTGRLTGVSTLSGYVTAKSGEKLIFSILMNNYLGSDITDIQDEILTFLAEYEFK